MNRLPSFVRQHLVGLRVLVVFTIITGIIYPLALVGLSQVAFSGPANGSLISFHGRIIGSSLLCQEFVDAKGNPLVQYFQPRPSAAIPSMAPKGDFGCDPTSSAASNFGPNNPTYIALIKQRQKAISAFDHVPISKIPSDAVTASGSGLDPDISQADAAIQVDRIATARHISPAQVRALVGQNTTGRTIGFLGQPVVNVLLLNRALDAKYPV
ncbi:MAG TPA: potassium-transporting ATPase subunit KdpC [Streptosporangiaceae bacterium]|jgi:K+-transporting ATPase ATPase C chain